MKTLTDFRLPGLTAATHTPTHRDGGIHLDCVEAQARHLVANRVAAVFVAGTTGESHSFTVAERQALTQRWCEIARDLPLKVVIHVGHNCLADARELAAHAEQAGADAIAALAPSYFRPPTVQHLAGFLGSIAAAAPRTPFYFYDIPSWTGVSFPTSQFLAEAQTQIPTCAGVKFTSSDLTELQRSVQFADGAYDILWGCDEALLAGLSLGCRGAVGSTYNFAAPLYHKVMRAFEQGDLSTARDEQLKAVRMVEVIARYGFTAAAKCVMGLIGVECGPARPPLGVLTAVRIEQLRDELAAIGFFDWISLPDSILSPQRMPAPHVPLRKDPVFQE